MGTYYPNSYNASNSFFQMCSTSTGSALMFVFFIWHVRGWVRKFCNRCYITINRHYRFLNYTLLERATILPYNDTKPMP